MQWIKVKSEKELYLQNVYVSDVEVEDGKVKSLILGTCDSEDNTHYKVALGASYEDTLRVYKSAPKVLVKHIFLEGEIESLGFSISKDYGEENTPNRAAAEKEMKRIISNLGEDVEQSLSVVVKELLVDNDKLS